jgi:hypothetical protein
MAPATELGFDVPDTRNVSMTTPPRLSSQLLHKYKPALNF